MFKFLQAQLVANLDAFFQQHFCKLLARGTREFLQQFAAEAYAYLLRKLAPDALEGHVHVVAAAVHHGHDAVLVHGAAMVILEVSAPLNLGHRGVPC
jgi:hypothetical protein